MTDDAARPEEETTDAAAAEGASGGEGGADSSAHSPQQAEAQNVREATDSADDSSGSTESSDANAAENSEPKPADSPTAAEPAATSEPSPEGSGSEAEQPSVNEEPAATPEPSADESKKLSVPGADLEPIALEPDENLSAEERARLEAEAEEERARREAELAAEKAEEDIPVREPAKLNKNDRFRATGKRKSAIARVIIKAGSGEIVINGRPLDEYFPRPLHQVMVRQPLATTGYGSGLEIQIRVQGGGASGQAAAIRHGIARALTEIDSELRGDLKRRGYLTRDARVKERHKAGYKKARKRPQFSKR